MSKRKSVDLLPVIFRTEANQRFLSGTVDQLIQQPDLKKVDGFIGDKTVSNYNPSVDSYLNTGSSLRTSYELEPAVVVRNPITEQVEYVKTYEDILNSLQYFGTDISNQDKIFKQQSYAWNPHIDLDKFINYRNYVWLQGGPLTIRITGAEKSVTSTIAVNTTVDNGLTYWSFSTDSVAVNPTITLYRGLTYIFDVSTVDQTFYIKTKRSSGSVDSYDNVTNNGTASGKVIFTVTEETPGTLYYVSGSDNTIFGKFLIRDQLDNTVLNVETDILGKTTYEIKPGVNLSNGMRIAFADTVIPESYRDKTFIVEGVGDSITLVDYERLVTIESYASSVETSFDSDNFDDLPFDEVSQYPVNPDYILINRASKDFSPWARYNRWFHIDVVNTSAELNNVEPNFDATDRAQRPIIEFKPNIQLFNFATSSKYVNFLDDTVTDAFSNIEGSLGYYIDGNQLEEGNRIVFTAENDSDVKNKIYQIQFIDIEGTKKIHLEETADTVSSENDGLLVLSGTKNGRTSWVYKNGEWITAQQKTALNQPPLFDIFDNNGVSYADSFYKDSNFTGCKLFGYQVGTGTNDSVLGFPIVYGSVANVGGYMFENCLSSDTYEYFGDNEIKTLSSKTGFIQVNGDTLTYINGWVKCNNLSKQEIIDQKIAIGGETALEFDSIDVRTRASEVRVFKNGKQLTAGFGISADTTFDAFYVNFATALVKDDVVTIKVVPTLDKKSTGYYEAPINLVNNPLNESPVNYSFAEINDHLNSILLNGSRDLNVVLDRNNLRDTPNLEKYGRRFVQHDGLVSMAGAFLTNKDFNFISAMRWSAMEYQRYKILVLQKFIELEPYASISDALDNIILDISKDKTPASTFYYSEMLPYGLNKRDYTYTVKDSNITAYAYGSEMYNRTALSNKSILVYINEQLLLVDRDYTFDAINPLIRFSVPVAVGDQIKIKVYNNIYGSAMPNSPTKLGLYPAFEPKIYTDDTFLDPVQVVQGHDGSITVCYGDDRDLLLLELEKRVFNNLKVSYNPNILDINDVLPGVFRTSHTIDRIDGSIEQEFLRWAGLYNIDYITNENAFYESNFGFNYVNSSSSIKTNEVVTGSWRKLYRYYFDTDRPHTCPWEMLGFFTKPTWWEAEYGPAPYTSGNDVLWEDLENGYIRSGERQGYDEKYARPGLSSIIPVNSYGELIDPIEANVAKSFDYSDRYGAWAFGDMGPSEAAWRRSHLYPFAVQIAMALNLSAKYFTVGYDTSRNVINNAGQIVYAETMQKLSPADLVVFGKASASSIVLGTGYHTYVVEYLRLRFSDPSTKLATYLNNLEANLAYKVGGFTSKDKFRVSLETVTNYKTVDKVFVPEENYQIVLNVGSPTKTLVMSGVIVERTEAGYAIRGYDNNNPYFIINTAIHAPNDPITTVGGTSEPFIYWAANANITGGSIVANGQKYFRAISSHVTKQTFDATLYYPLPYLPTVGGTEAIIAQSFEDVETVIPYGTVYHSSQDVYDFILGYGNYLVKQGFVFETVLSELELIADWNLAGKEFLFWSLQKWAVSSVISLAPFAAKVEFTSADSVVDDVYDTFYDYTLLKSDGTALDNSRVSIVREEGSFIIDTGAITNDGVYYVKINLVQKEHVVVFDNDTMFNDLIYEPVSGYRQRRFKVKGFMTDNWKGDFYVPGFVYDSAKIEDWEINVDYQIGTVIKFQTKYYQAKKNLLAAASFDYEVWALLGEQPVAQLLPNFEYKINQFEDFYSLDTVNFDNSQQAFAQKLIGYVPRTYLNSLIPDESSQYKFYQGFIREKGTAQPLEKFAVANNVSTGSHIELQEEWAIRLGMFGGDNAYKEVEFTLDQNKFNQDPQIFQFEYGTNKATLDKAYKVPLSDVLIKPEDFVGTPWPVLNVDTAFGNGYKQYQKIPTAGYPRIDDVTYTGLYENNILSLTTNTSMQEGDTVWIAMDNKSEWDVKRYSLSPSTIINYVIDNSNQLLSFDTDTAHNLKLRDFVSITRLGDGLDGIYEVIGVPTTTSFVVASGTNDIPDSAGVLSGSLYYFSSSRFGTLDDLANLNGLGRWQNCEFVWVDDDGTGRWAVYEKEDCTLSTLLRPYVNKEKQSFGNTVIIAPKSNAIITSATTTDLGAVYIYERSTVGDASISLLQGYLLEENVSDILTIQTVNNGSAVPQMERNHGYSLTCWESDDLLTRYIVSGAPNSSNAKWENGNVSESTLKKPLAYSNGPSTYVDEGAIKIVKFNTVEKLYNTELVLASPIPQAGALFGSSVKLVGTSKPTLLVSAPGQDDSAGAVFVYYLDSNNVWQVYSELGIAYNIRTEVADIGSNAEFGSDMATSADGKYLAVSAPGVLKDRTQVHTGAVYIFTKDASTEAYSLLQTVYADDYLQPNDLILKGVYKSYAVENQILTFVAASNALVRNKGSFITDGFRVGQTVIIDGSGFNDGEYVIGGISSQQMTFKSLLTVIDENVANDMTVTGAGTARKDRFGDKIEMSADGSTIVISSDHASSQKLDAGMVYVIKLTSDGQYTLDQAISSPNIEAGEMFGNNLSLSADGNILLVTAAGGGQSTPVAFDSYTERLVNSTLLYGSEYVLNQASSLKAVRTTFDGGSTRFVSRSLNSGNVYMFQKLGTKYIYGQSLISGDSASADGYGTGLATDGKFCVVGAPKYDLKVQSDLDATALTVYKDAGTVAVFDYKSEVGELRSWRKQRYQSDLIDIDKIKKVISYDNETLNILDYYEIFDPVKGKIPSKVVNEIKYTTPFDPAVYSLAVQTSKTVRVDNKTTWTEEHVGELWLDTSTLRYVWYEQGNDEYRSNNWGKLFPGSTVDVYEWVKSDYRPSDWAELADTPEGLALGISGQPKNPDNTVVSLNQYFDPVINDFVNVYFYWVRNKITLPELNFRSISSFDCARIIEDPKLQGIKYAAFLSPGSVSLANTKSKLKGDKINIDVYYQTTDQEINRHSQWQLINENMKYLNIDPSIETKLFDSLVGQDVAGNIIPDPHLSPKIKYGTSFRPRQSWFKDRDLALKTMIEYTNTILEKFDVVGKVNLESIDVFDPSPLENTGQYDEVLESSDDISSVGTNGKVQAQLTAEVNNGKIVNINIVNPGNGYKIAPTVRIYGIGDGATIQTAIDLSGKVVGVKILSQGTGYTEVPKLLVRPYAVLTTIDTEINKWAIHYYRDGTFQREMSQTYDVRKYWSYIDWVDSSYSVDVPPKYVINYISDLETSTFAVGDTIQIRTPGDGRSIILRKTVTGLGNYLNEYDLIYRQNGTVKFSNKLYDKTAAGIGFDNIVRYDQSGFDESNLVELRIILDSIKNKIFINDLAIYWNKFIFVAIRHVLTEQLFVDWIYKTSFVTPQIDAGTLDQKDVYRFNDFGYVEEFIKEIKPYKSKFRDITVSHNATESADIGVTDFDLPPYVDPLTDTIKVPEGSIIANQYPFKHWYNNYGYGITEIRVGLTGANYFVPPIVQVVTQSGDTGSGATAVAKISDGKLSSIEVITPGSGYTKTPTILLIGGANYTSTFVPGTAYAVMSNTKVRTNLVKFKFDRLSEKGLFTGEYYNRVVTTDGTTLNYVLSYPANSTDTNYPALQDENTIKLFLNDAAISQDNYRITFRSDLSTVITFNVALPANQQLRINYIKNVLYTVDRFTQTSDNYTDTFRLTFPPDLDNLKIIAKLVNTSNNTGSEISASDYLLQIKQIKENGFTKYVGYIKFKSIPAVNSVITVQYAKNINIQNAVDRIITSYYPTAGMPGKDVTQLMKGVEFGGVEITGLNFKVSSGWDGLPWFTQGWDTFVNEYKDFLVISDGTTDTYDLGYIPLAGTQINVYFDGVRVDDENFGTNTQIAGRLFGTIITNGASSTITLPVLPSKTYTNIPASNTTGSGKDATFDVIRTGGEYSATVNNVGTDYFSTSKILYVPTEFTPSTTVTAGEYLRTPNGLVYSVTTSGETSNAVPTFTNGSAINGTSTLTYEFNINDKKIKVSNTTGIFVGMRVLHSSFNSVQTVLQIINNDTLLLSNILDYTSLETNVTLTFAEEITILGETLEGYTPGNNLIVLVTGINLGGEIQTFDVLGNSFGIKIEVRQSLSDGVNLPTDDYVLDTNLSGGDFSVVFDAGETRFSTASGLRADDIAVDGGEFLSVVHSPATEELVRGEIFDTLSMTVYSSPGTGANVITTNQFIMDGSSMTFRIEGVPDSTEQLDVYIGNFYANRSEDYTVSTTPLYTDITITTDKYGVSDLSPTNRMSLTVQKIDIGGSKILGRVTYEVTASDATSDGFAIATALNINDIGSYYTSTTKETLIAKNSARTKRATITVLNTGIKLTAGTIINIVLFGSTVKTYSEVYNQEILINNSTNYTLTKPPGTIAPLHVMASVTRLTPSTIDWRGEWTEGAVYNVNDSVIVGNISYVCKLANTGIGSTTTQTFTAWAPNTTYVAGAIKVFAGVLYICIAGHTSNSSNITPVNTTYWTVHVTNRPDEDTTNTYWDKLPTQRMLPPETEYYEVTESEQTFRLGENIPYLSRSLAISDIEVYKNGKIMVVGQDYTFNSVANEITMRQNVSTIGDVIAVCVLKDADYLIRDGKIYFTSAAKLVSGQKVNVTTYTNHDENLMRREIFKTFPYRNDYKLSRTVKNINNVWVDLNGRPLTPNVDFKIVDNLYVQLSNIYVLKETDRLVVTSISDVISAHAIAYRMFKDMTNATQFKRISKDGSVTLMAPLSINDREIEVSDTSIFGSVSVTNSRPSVVFIAGERIEFRSISGSKLGNLTRGTLGTGPADVYPVGTKVFNGGQTETIPYREGFTIKKYKTPSNFIYNQTTATFQQMVNDVWTDVTSVVDITLTDIAFNDAVAYEDQVSVYMAGKLLTKPTKSGNVLTTHDFSITNNSDELNSVGQTGDIEVLPEFTISKVGSAYVLTINPTALILDDLSQVIPDVEIKVVQKIGKIWYTLGGSSTMQNETTAQAKFLQQATAELPDKYYYGLVETADEQSSINLRALRSETGSTLTDEDGNILEQE